jgi:hypothetical protein
MSAHHLLPHEAKRCRTGKQKCARAGEAAAAAVRMFSHMNPNAVDTND